MSAPLRKVVERQDSGRRGWRGGGSWVDRLECGHKVAAKKSAGAPDRRRCHDCAEMRKNRMPDGELECSLETMRRAYTGWMSDLVREVERLRAFEEAAMRDRTCWHPEAKPVLGCISCGFGGFAE